MIQSPRRNFLRSVRVFISHDWDDNELTDVLYKKLSAIFDVFYDRAPLLGGDFAHGLKASDNVLPVWQIPYYDFFIFVGSDASLSERSGACVELRHAENLRYPKKPVILYIRVGDAHVDDHYADQLWLSLWARSCAQDADHICKHITANADQRLLETRGRTSGQTAVGADLNGLVEVLGCDYRRGRYLLNSLWPSVSKMPLVKLVRAMRRDDRRQVLGRTIDVFLQEKAKAHLVPARDNALVLAAMIAAGDCARSKEVMDRLKHHCPDYSTSSLYRGYQIALALLGSDDAMPEYALRLSRSTGTEWEGQRFTNRKYHIQYYEGLAPALAVLRESIVSCDPSRLLPMNVYTLGVLSQDETDAMLLCEQGRRLKDLNVPPSIIKQAVGQIRLKAKGAKLK